MLATLVLSSSPDAGAYTGTLDKQLIMKGIHAQRPTVRRCFVEPPRGKLVVRFVIGPDGRVTESELAEPSPLSNKTVTCVLKAMKAVKTEPPVGGSVLVTYPFIFKMSGS
ncbi:MAG: energy transducer TonB [Archangiaceae bacterium]|nr:energy transducer TonB [Archangiaceae bacterium]